jgi:phosphoribulokinase
VRAAGNTAVRNTFEGLFERVSAALIEGDSFHIRRCRWSELSHLLARFDDAFQARRDTIVVPGAKLEFVMQFIMTPLVQDLVGESPKSKIVSHRRHRDHRELQGTKSNSTKPQVTRLAAFENGSTRTFGFST